MKKILIGLSVVTAIMIASSTQAFVVKTEITESQNEKDIQIRRTQNEDLHVNFRPLNKGYAKGEKIRFSVHGNDDFYLYLFTISQRTGKAHMILPNRIQKENKYNGGMAHNVPNANVEFYSDNVGNEKVVYVASRKYLDWNVRGYNKVGDFLQTTSKNLDEQIEKQIVLQRRNKPERRNKPQREAPIRAYQNNSQRYADDDVFIGEFSFYVGNSEQRYSPQTVENSARHESTEAGNASYSQPILFLETNGKEFGVGDNMKIIYGADRTGYVHLYTRMDGQGFQKVLTKKVDGRSFYTSRPRVSTPLGRQHLLLVFTERATFNSKNLESSITDGIAEKGLTYSSRQGKKAAAPYISKKLRITR
jgi:hypothetical protein